MFILVLSVGGPSTVFVQRSTITTVSGLHLTMIHVYLSPPDVLWITHLLFFSRKIKTSYCFHTMHNINISHGACLTEVSMTVF